MKRKLLYSALIGVLCLLSTRIFGIDASSRFTAELEGSQEVSSIEITNAAGDISKLNNGPIASGGYGVGEMAISLDHSSLEYSVEILNIGSEIQKVHIHLGPRGGNGPLLFSIFNIADGGAFALRQAGFLTLADLQVDPAATPTLEQIGISTMEDVFTNLNSGNLYFNIHTAAVPSGELRGQVEPD